MSDAIVKDNHAPALPDPKAEAIRNDNYKFAMWLYLASEVILFGVFIGSYALFRVNEPEAVRAVHERVGIGLVSFNTFLLLTSSWSMVMGLREIQRDNVRGLLNWFTITAVLGTVFLILQYFEYQELAHFGITLDIASSDQLFRSFGSHFYTPTFFHGFHVFVGILWCLFVMRRAQQGAFSRHRYTGVEVFGLYWHFVDVVWIILFTLIYLI